MDRPAEPPPDLAITDLPDEQRYEGRIGDEVVGVVEYRIDDQGRRVLRHTEVDDRFEGRGIGSKLARAVLEDLKAKGMPARVTCPFLTAYVRRHPDLAPREAA